MLLLDPVLDMDVRVLELSRDSDHALLHVFVAVSRDVLFVGQLTLFTGLFILSIFVLVKEDTELSVVLLLGLLDREHGLQLGGESLQVLHELSLLRDEFLRLLEEYLEVPLFIFLNNKNRVE